MGFLKINKLSYKGDKYFYESPMMNNKIVIIEGPNGVGKSTFFDLLYYGLSGKVEQFKKGGEKQHEQIVFDKNNSVTLDVSINNESYRLIRRIGANSILVLSDGSSGDEMSLNLPINRGKAEDYIFSDWILNKLNISVFNFTQGNNTFKINFTDLLRLVYHNQLADPSSIYKQSDNSGYVSDSLNLRKAIFEILVGKSLLDYYAALSDLKVALKEKDSARSIYVEYKKLVEEINQGAEVKNSQFITKEISENEKRLDQLIQYRKEIVKIKPAPDSLLSSIDSIKNNKAIKERKLNRINAKISSTERELLTIVQGKDSTQIDIDRISKIILTHEQLSLFSPDTCPYCLKDVCRVPNQCVCGNEVVEEDYQRYFYSSEEYQELLKYKIKSLQSFDSAIDSFNESINRLNAIKEKMEDKIRECDKKLHDMISNLAIEVDSSKVDSVEDKISELREQISELYQLLKMEAKLEGFNKELSVKESDYKKKEIAFKKVEIESESQLKNRILEFGDIYNDLMKNSLSDVRKAEISTDTYLPVINDGIYREASSKVSVRFLYFITLLKMSLELDIPYPKLILVDTPETAGIDKDNLDLILSKLNDLSTDLDVDFQAIVATGVGKYPSSMKDMVVVKLSKESKLLHKI
ncbi:hypothetical protein L4D06_19770 [Enterovibrio makurazakiensis]|uniref:hypothetical protein n=1 Tax=Enterovibrio makurazakiensis TaxID=2910232 RepID=UPI003D1EE0DE